MDIKKTLLSAAAAAIAVSSFAVPAFAIDFPDVTADHWAYQSVMLLADYGTVNGDENGYFNPSSQVTRAEMVKMIGMGGADASYNDVDESHWGHEYIRTSGVAPDADGNFRPSEPMSRGDVIKLLWQRAGSKTGSDAPESVRSQLDNPDAAAWGYAEGIMQGYEDGSMRYENGITRAEAAAIIVRSNKNIHETYAYVQKVKPQITDVMYNSFGALDGVTYGSLAQAQAAVAGGDASKLIPEGHSADETASMKDAASMLSDMLRKLNPSVPAYSGEDEYLTVPTDGAADAERIGAILYLADKAAPLGVKYSSDNKAVSISAVPPLASDGYAFAYRTSEVPVTVYSGDLGAVSGSPFNSYKFAVDFSGLFTSVTKWCEDTVREQYKIDSAITFYPSLVWNTGSSYKYRVRCDIKSVNGQSLTYKDVFGGEAQLPLQDGMTFYADIESDYAFGMGIAAVFNISDPLYIEMR